MGFQITENLGKDPGIRDLSKSSIPGPPEGYRALLPSERTPSVGQAARFILEHSQLGDQIAFNADGKSYLGRSEPHYHDPPPPGSTPEEAAQYPKPWGWHRGVTVFKALEDKEPQPGENWEPEKPTSGRMQFLQRINNLLSGIED